MAAILSKKVNIKGKKVGIIISGGNIDPDKLTSVTETQLEEQGRKGIIKVKLANTAAAKKLIETVKKCDGKLYFSCGCAACEQCLPLKKEVELKVYFTSKVNKTKFAKFYKFI
ncbi:MAG: hypothetical protein K2M43_01955 [Mycoplasmoidaceae bacterium]|nr:hypothetical protein [Mycoplasmoidaceae bacterium]